jgi:glycerol-3-phosphate acyltransferase PlsY
MTAELPLALLAAFLGYMIGSISFARVLGRWLAPGQLEGTTAISWGEGKRFVAENVSATSLAQRRGPRYGCLTAILDILKATGPVLILHLLYPNAPYDVIYSVAVMVGHNFPIYYRFKGGRGTSVLLGSLLVLDPLSIPVTIFFGYAIGLMILKDVLLAHHAGWIVLLPFWFAITGQRDLILFALIVNVLRWSVSGPEIKTYLTYRRTGELRSREFHEAIEKTHIGYIHGFLRRRRLITYPYMREE